MSLELGGGVAPGPNRMGNGVHKLCDDWRFVSQEKKGGAGEKTVVIAIAECAERKGGMCRRAVCGEERGKSRSLVGLSPSVSRVT